MPMGDSTSVDSDAVYFVITGNYGLYRIQALFADGSRCEFVLAKVEMLRISSF